MVKTVAVLGIVVAFGLFLFSVLPPTVQPNGHVWESWHPEALFLVHPDAEFACKYSNGTQLLYLQYDPDQPDCPPRFGGAIILALGGLLVTAFVATLSYWRGAINRGEYTREDD